MLLSLQHFGGRGACQSSKMGLRIMTSNHSLTRTCTKPNNKLINAQLEHFGARTSNKQTWTHKTYHGPDLGEAPPSPLQVTLCLATGPSPKCHFVLRLPNGSPEIHTTGIPVILGVHNFACRPLIEMKSEEKLQPSSRTFQQYVARHLHAKKSEQFLTFSGPESNWP